MNSSILDIINYKPGKRKQFLFSILIVVIVSLICYALAPYMGYRVIAFILLVTVSLIAIMFEILPVLLAATLSAFIWDFFFIPPHFTVRVESVEDRILLTMYFIIAIINAFLTLKIRQVEKIVRQREENAATIKLYNTLLNSLSHELRTPIAAIIGANDNLQNNGKNLSPEQKNELRKEISKASLRLNQQVENLLNLSRLESGFIQPKNDWCDIQELVYDMIYRIEENKISQKIHININPDIPLFKLDKGMLEQIIYNIIYNATIYTNAGSTIDISVNCYADVLEINIEDNGPGFPVAEMEKVFDKFYRLNNSRTGGTGLGLSIVKGFTAALGGTVVLQNAPSGGARFIIRIAAETSYLKNLKNE